MYNLIELNNKEVIKLSSKEINQLIVKRQLKIIDCYEDMLNHKNSCMSYLSNVEHIYYMRLLNHAYNKFFSEN